MRRLTALVRSWFRIDLTPEPEKTATNQRLDSQSKRLTALESIRPAYSQMSDRLTDRRSKAR